MRERVNLRAFFQLFPFYVNDMAHYLDFLLNLKPSSSLNIEIPEGLPMITCCQDKYAKNEMSEFSAKFFDFFWRLPVILPIWFLKLRHIFTPWKSLFILGIWSPRIIVMFFALLIIGLLNLTPFGAAKVPSYLLTEGSLVQKARIPKPSMIDYLINFIKLTIRRFFWFVLSALLAVLCFILLLGEGFFWYNFLTGGHSPLQSVISPYYKEFTYFPFIGPLPAPIYLHTQWGWVFIIPFITLFTVVVSLWKKFEQGLESVPIFEYFTIFFRWKEYNPSQRILAYFGLITIVTEAFFAIRVIYRWISTTSYIANSLPLVRGIISFILGIFVPIIFTLIEVYLVYAIYTIWKRFILS